MLEVNPILALPGIHGNRRPLMIKVLIKVSSYSIYHPVPRTAQRALHLTCLLWEPSNHAAINAQTIRIQIFTTIYNQLHLLVQLSELEQRRVKERAQGLIRQHGIQT